MAGLPRSNLLLSTIIYLVYSPWTQGTDRATDLSVRLLLREALGNSGRSSPWPRHAWLMASFVTGEKNNLKERRQWDH